jgi:hypothetical protein
VAIKEKVLIGLKKNQKKVVKKRKNFIKREWR